MKPRIFLSHSKVDRELIEKLAEDLRPGRVDVWYDDWEIPAGSSLREKIFSDGIGKCDVFFVYLTPASAKSKWVREEVDVALMADMERESTFVALYVDGDTTRDLLRDDLKIRRIPAMNQKNYSQCLLELVSRAWEASRFKMEDRLQAIVGISDTQYNYQQFFDVTSAECVVVAQNLRTLISKGFLTHAEKMLDKGKHLTIILTTYEAMRAISEIAGDHFIESIRELSHFISSLPKVSRELVRVHFHPGATSLSAMIRRGSKNDAIVFAAKWATDVDPDSRIHCVIQKNHSPDLFARLVGHLSYMTSPGWPSLGEMCRRFEIPWNEAEPENSADPKSRAAD